MKFQTRLLCNSTRGTAKFPPGMRNEIPWNGLGWVAGSWGCGNSGMWKSGMWNSGMHLQKQEQLLPGGIPAAGDPKKGWAHPGEGTGSRVRDANPSFLPPTSPTVTPVKPKPAFNLSFKRVHYRLSSKPGLHSPQLALLKFFPRCIYEEFINLISFNFFFSPAGSLCQALFYFWHDKTQLCSGNTSRLNNVS